MGRIYGLLQKSGKPPDLVNPPVFGEEGRQMVPGVVLGYRGSASDGTDIAVLAGILQRQWRVLAVCTLGGAVVALFATLLMKPVYEPEARLDIDPPGYEQFSLEPQAVSSDTEYLQTQVQNLQSAALAVAVIRKLHLAPDSVDVAGQAGQRVSGEEAQQLTPGESAALREFQSRLKVEHDPGSRVISVAVSDHNPVRAARVTNALSVLFVDRMADARHDAILQSVQWLSEQLKDIRKQMDDSNRALVNFQRVNGIADVDEGKSTFGELLADLNKQRTQTAADRIQLEALLNKVHNGDPDALPQVHESSLIQQLTQKLAEATAELAQSRAIYGPNHPNVKRLENQSAELEAQLNKQKQGILDQLRTAYAAARAREQLMSHEVTDTTRQLSLVAQYNALKREARSYTDLYNTLYSKVQEAAISAASKSSNIRIVDPARVLDRPSRPRRPLNLFLGSAAGLALGIVTAFIFEGLDSSIRTAEDIHACGANLSVSVVPVIDIVGNKGSRRLPGPVNGGRLTGKYQPLLLSRPKSPEAEAVRGLRTSLILSRLNQPPQVLLIASSLQGEGKTTVAVNLAVALAQQARTCVVDCDRRNSVISSIFNRISGPGLGEVLAGTAPLPQAVFGTHVPGLCVLPCGRATEGAYDVAGRQSMKEMLAELRQHFPFIVVDSPPILPYADGRVLSTIVDGVVFVGRPHLTTREAMKRSLELLSQLHSAPILEVVLNAAGSDAADYQYYRYGYKS
jgi:succinoglycan biosynthesis transport protein ExoP